MQTLSPSGCRHCYDRRVRPIATSALLLTLYTIILCFLVLSPFDFYTGNAVRWARADHAIDFPSAGIVRSLVPPRRLHRALTSGSGFALEVWLRASRSDQSGPARIVSYSMDTRARNFTLGQDGSNLDFRLRTTETTLNGIPSLKVADVFARSVRRHIVITYDSRVLCAYIDSQLETCRPSPAGRFTNWDPNHHLLLGNERTVTRPWLGTLFLVALYDRPLSATDINAAYTAGRRSPPSHPATEDGLVAFYAFGEGSGYTVRDASPHDPLHLAIPRVLEEHHCGFLSWQSSLSRVSPQTIADVTTNVLMFVPFGLLCCILLRYRGRSCAASTIATLGIAGTFTIGIESFQYFLVSRCSQLEDVMLNLLGACISVLVASAGPRFRLRSHV
jgi:VanZ family protein